MAIPPATVIGMNKTAPIMITAADRRTTMAQSTASMNRQTWRTRQQHTRMAWVNRVARMMTS